jgi:molybdenum cofactor synthesis domain-containing protein
MSGRGRAVVVTVSDRVAAGERADESGPVLVEGLRSIGFDVSSLVVADDHEQVVAALQGAVVDGADVVLTTGGTGLAPRDVTPEATLAVLDRLAPGIAEAVRAAGAGVPTAPLSRGVAGVAGPTLVVNVAGSPGAARDALSALMPLLPHAVAQLRGADH